MNRLLIVGVFCSGRNHRSRPEEWKHKGDGGGVDTEPQTTGTSPLGGPTQEQSGGNPISAKRKTLQKKKKMEKGESVE